MSSLPPYSTYRTDAKQMMYPQATSHGNILTFTPPGFSQQLNVKFPDSRLAVCAKCKKNFKTRDMCRVRNTHTSPPWTTAFVCITIDDSCLDEQGKFVDKPMTVRMVQWQPYCVMKAFDPKTPVCAACKRTNRTRSFCRERHKHRQLPWCTVYVLLSTLDVADPSTVVAGASQKVSIEEGNGESKPAAAAAAGAATSSSAKLKRDDSAAEGDATVASDTKEEASSVDATDAGAGAESGEGDDPGDDINDINENRTFLAKVSSRSTTIHWLELAEYDSSEAAPFPGTVPVDAQQQYHAAMAQMPPHPMDPNQPSSQYYQQNMNYAAQQHQNALKSRQQYFFQMQQQHQYPPPLPHAPGGGGGGGGGGGPPPPPGSHWQQSPYGMALPPGQPHPPHAHAPPPPPGAAGDVGPPPHHAPLGPPGATAGEAAAAQQRRGGGGPPGSSEDMQFQHPQQHWAAMYYQGPPPPPPPTGMPYPPPHPPHPAHQGEGGSGSGNTQGTPQGGDASESASGGGGGGENDNEHYHTPPEQANGEDGPDDKRQRTV